ncbi:hypothetical protein CDAR_525961 [Caerostris darwini]|uniref:Uncharacterized protein n=1 Tax=Caerostris darwini TaxID=1538125 RepID=A0AAV4S4W1_9ARAC|nr:hypothetical protein CDAR_525961 [Caerostris darwini]
MLCATDSLQVHANKPPQRRCHSVIRSRLPEHSDNGQDHCEIRTDFPTLSDDSNNWIVNLASWFQQNFFERNSIHRLIIKRTIPRLKIALDSIGNEANK